VSPWNGFAVDQTDKTPVYAQLERAIRSGIAAGRLAVGDQLPTVRQLAVDLRVNANTVAKVYAFLERAGVLETAFLERAGVLETRRGVGTFVAARSNTPQEEALRKTELNRLVDRFLAELSHHGFHVDEAIPEIERRRQEGA
jgi:GntR family transcriptional regulator